MFLIGKIMKIKVLFFGVLMEVTGSSLKVYEEVKSLEHLKMRIADDHPETVHYSYRIAVNNEFIDGDLPLKDGDEVAFLPPFAGG
jgi:molybdopterin synthase sulfur carrier subunit